MYKTLAWVVLASATVFFLLVLALFGKPTRPEFLERCTAMNGIVVKHAFTTEIFCIDRSVVKASK